MDRADLQPVALPPAPADWPPLPVRTLTAAYLDLVDEHVPGLVEGLYLHGSLAFGEWHDGRSDVDFVAVSSRRPGGAELRRLRAVHDELTVSFPAPAFDGGYVTWDDLAGPPAAVPDIACSFGGQWADEGRTSLNPVAWHELASRGVALRGPAPADVPVWTDEAVLRRFTHDNLRSYWAPNVVELAKFPTEAAAPDVVAWFVLGTARLHHLLATGELTTKDGAGHHAVAAFGEQWRPLVAEALAYRAIGELAGLLDAEQRSEHVVAFSDLVVRSGLEIPV